ncbi:glycosyltransferase family 2 protein, partial [Staphylococcus aureus]|nr:glycosyltransferase family 2 protein [Staphylococcus aureus]
PTYNEEENIRECLRTIFDQSINNYEVIVVDDGSTDKTVDIIKEFKNVKVFSENHKGAGAARNLGAKKANGDIFVFVDADMSFDKS